jgi:hypothetical protein
MKKKITALFASLAIIVSLIPSVFADNSEYVGYFRATDQDGVSFAELNILTCTENSFTLDFKREKNGVEKFTYTFEEGTLTNNEGTAVFHAKMASSAVIDGIAALSFINNELIKITCTSNQNELFYEGVMKRVAAPSVSPQPSQSPEQPNQPAASDDVSITVNGQKIVFENDPKPQIINNFTYIPLRSVLNTMGINVYWDEYDKNEILKEQLITCTKNSVILQFARTKNETGENAWTLKKWDGKNTDSADCTNIDIINLQPIIIGNSSYIPLRVVSEAFGAKVDWDNDERNVIIECDTANEYRYEKDMIDKIEDFTMLMAQSYITSDFTSVVPHSTPYFAPQGKFYLFDAKDRWNEITLRIFKGETGAYIDVLAKTAETAEPAIAETTGESTVEASAETVAETSAETSAEESTEASADTSAETNSEESAE